LGSLSSHEFQKLVYTIRSLLFLTKHISDGHRFASFAPIRTNITCEWFVNGRSYFEALLRAIPLATHEIFIAGWWVAPALYLARDRPELDRSTQLGNLLKTRAEQGVKVYILIWNETNWGYNLGSYSTKTWLENQR
jgi:phospholipase D1/2